MGKEDSSETSSPIDGLFHVGNSPDESVCDSQQSGKFWKGACETGSVDASRENESAAEEIEHCAFTSKAKSYPWNNGVEL